MTATNSVYYDEQKMKSLSQFNGAVNNMNTDDIKRKLANYGLNTRGCIDVLRKRLKVYHKKKTLGGTKQCKYKYLCVIDFEATCEKDDQEYIHEIIEFPAVLIDVEKRQIIDEFHRYCQPVKNPQLTEFCQKLTGITQDQVNSASQFPEVLKQFEAWSAKYRAKARPTDNFFAIVTDGPWDIKRFFTLQCEHSGLEIPSYTIQWINIRKSFNAFYHFKGKLTLLAMIESLGLSFEGRQHCGLHDARNIANILITLLVDGAEIKMNEKLDISKSDDSRKQERKKRSRNKREDAISETFGENLGVDPDMCGQEFLILSKSAHSKISKP